MSDHSSEPKRCGKCRRWRLREHFAKACNQEDGLQKWCRTCQHNHYEDNRLEFSRRQKEYRERNHEKLRVHYSKYRSENHEKIRQYSKEFREKNRERLSKEGKIRYQLNKEKIKAHYQKNRAKFSATREKYRTRVMIEALMEYGGKCRICGDTRLWALTLAHTNNDGRLCRDQNKAGGSTFAIRLRKWGYPKDRGIGVECYNCNCAASRSTSWRRKQRDQWVQQNR